MGPLHPFTTHFPVALLLAYTLLTLLSLWRATPRFETSGYHAGVLGLIGALVAVLSGLWDAARQLPLSNDVLLWLNAHAFSGLLVSLCYGRLLLLRRRHAHILFDTGARRGYLALHVAGAACIIASGYLGGHLVYGLRLGVMAP